jgi:cell wall-associated NlpC family hydrolase
MKRLTWDTSLELDHTQRIIPTLRRLGARVAPYHHSIASSISRVGHRQWLHGVVISLGVGAAAVAWAQPRQRGEVWDVVSIVADHVSDRIDDIQDIAQSAQDIAQSAFETRTHVVEPGETLLALADSYDVSIATIAWSNRLMDPDRITPGQRLLIPSGNTVVHPVREGDTVKLVAARYETDAVELANANQLSPDAIEEPITTSQLIVPNPKLPDVSEIGAPEGKMASAVKNALVYEVQDGDTLLSLANQFGVTVPTLLRANGIDDPDSLSIGTKLRVMPASGVEHEVRTGESLEDLAGWYEVDLGPIIDFNGLINADRVRVGSTLFIPGAAKGPKPIIPFVPAPAVVQSAPEPVTRSAPQPLTRSAPEPAARSVPQPAGRSASASASASGSSNAVARAPQQTASNSSTVARAPAPAPAQNNTVAAAAVAPVRPIGGGTAGVSGNAMQFLGRPYVWGGTGPYGFDCSGFVWYVHKISGKDISRGLWGQMNAGPRVPKDQLQAGDSVFFANTYMPGLSHAGIYIGGGRFIHASDERTGVTISSLGDSYWGPKFIGATRI